MASNNILVGKSYRGLIISIAVFIIMIAGFLFFTLYVTTDLVKYGAMLNVTNKVSLDQETVMKDLFDLQNSYGEDIASPHMQTVLKRLEKNSKNIEHNLDAIRNEGMGIDPTGDRDKMPEIKDQKTLDVLTLTQQQWDKLRPKIEAYLAVANNLSEDPTDELSILMEQAKTSSIQLNELYIQLNDRAWDIAEERVTQIEVAQLLAVILMLVYFVFFVTFNVRRLRQSDREVSYARQETSEIMETVSTGLFLLDKDLNIGQQHSKALESIMGTSRLAGENFTSVLRNRISEKDLETTRQFIEQLYNPRVKEKLVNDLNPLYKVMLHNDDGQGSVENRYLDFKFSRVYENDEIARILVNVSDISDAVMLEQRLEKERAQNDLQIEMLTTILNVSPTMITEFIDNTKKHIDKMNNILKNPGSSQTELESKLGSIYREMHSLKGEASALKLHSFTKIASDAEDKLQGLQKQGRLSGNDFLPLAVHLDDLLNLSTTIEILGERINQSSPAAMQIREAAASVMAQSTQVAEPEPVDFDDMDVLDDLVEEEKAGFGASNDTFEQEIETQSAYYESFVQQIAKRQQKKVVFQAKGIDDIDIPKHLSAPLKEISVQLVRNAIVHGLETPDERQLNNKSSTGKVVMAMQQKADNLVLMVQDDGAGIDYSSIRKKLVDMGRYDIEKAKKLNKNQLLKELFSSGFSTKDDADEDGGRGVGLDIIKDRVKELKGKLNVHSELGKMTRFIISLPASQ